MYFSLQIFHRQNVTGIGLENLDRAQYIFQPIKFSNSVVPSPCVSQPYIKTFVDETQGVEGGGGGGGDNSNERHRGVLLTVFYYFIILYKILKS